MDWLKKLFNLFIVFACFNVHSESGACEINNQNYDEKFIIEQSECEEESSFPKNTSQDHLSIQKKAEILNLCTLILQQIDKHFCEFIEDAHFLFSFKNNNFLKFVKTIEKDSCIVYDDLLSIWEYFCDLSEELKKIYDMNIKEMQDETIEASEDNDDFIFNRYKPDSKEQKLERIINKNYSSIKYECKQLKRNTFKFIDKYYEFRRTFFVQKNVNRMIQLHYEIIDLLDEMLEQSNDIGMYAEICKDTYCDLQELKLKHQNS